jgi:hypothetical protein
LPNGPLTEEDKHNIETVKSITGKGFIYLFNFTFFIDETIVTQIYLNCNKNVELTINALLDIQ